MFVSNDEFTILSRRVDRLEHHVSKIASRIDSIVNKIETFDKQKSRESSARSDLFSNLGQQ
ncbi:unnamed protein product [Oikopleura dioica]|uniref:Uncharacterized protein n=1 Tax=Oikopleura dioica TaxID=34765 RepID=E4YK45_OIKDI|nr:unnamed protein product [Oikopleura dioica]